MTFDHNIQKSHVPGFLELLVNALSTTSRNESAKQTCKSHTAFLEISNTIKAPLRKYQLTILKNCNELMKQSLLY